MPVAALTSKGQVTIPRAVRERLRLEAGDKLDFSVDEAGRIIIERTGGDPRELRGLLYREAREPVSIEAMNEAIRREVTEALRRILETRSFLVEGREIVRKAVRAFRTGSGDFADYLIGEKNRRAGCRATATLDKALRGSDLFELL